MFYARLNAQSSDISRQALDVQLVEDEHRQVSNDQHDPAPFARDIYGAVAPVDTLGNPARNIFDWCEPRAPAFQLRSHRRVCWAWFY